MSYQKALQEIITILNKYDDTRSLLSESPPTATTQPTPIVDDDFDAVQFITWFNARAAERMPNARKMKEAEAELAREIFDNAEGNLETIDDAITYSEDHHANKSPITKPSAYVKAILAQRGSEELSSLAHNIKEQRKNDPNEEAGIFGSAEERSKAIANQMRSSQGESIAEKMARLKGGVGTPDEGVGGDG